MESCLAEDYRDRPSLADLISEVQYGMDRWEGTYGWADVAEPPEFMTWDHAKEEQFPIGSAGRVEHFAPEEKRWRQRPGSEEIETQPGTWAFAG